MTALCSAAAPPSRGHGLGVRLVFWTVFVSGLLSVLASAVQLYFSYQRDLAQTRESLTLFERSFHSSLSSALWEFNFRQIDVILNGLAADKDVASIELLTTTGQRFEIGEASEDLIYESIALDRPDGHGQQLHLGDLRVGLTLANVNARLWSQFWTLLTTNLAKTLAASCAMLLLFHWLVARHLAGIADHVRQVDLATPLSRLVLSRRTPNTPDDLDSVVAAINTAQDRIGGSYETVERLNRQLEASNLELSRSNEELERFAFVAAHDLQEPLRKISAFGDLLAEEYGDRLDNEGREYLGFMVDAAQRQQALVKDLLTYSLLDADSATFEPVDLTEVVEASLADLEALLEESGGSIQVSILPTVLGNRSQLQQVFTNLIGNALKYRSPDRSPRIALVAREQGSGAAGSPWSVDVRDNGIGFPPAQAEDLFKLFRRLHSGRIYPGTGIGLAIVRKIVQQHSGTIVADSTPGLGSVFTVTLPRAAQGEESTA